MVCDIHGQTDALILDAQSADGEPLCIYLLKEYCFSKLGDTPSGVETRLTQ